MTLTYVQNLFKTLEEESKVYLLLKVLSLNAQNPFCEKDAGPLGYWKSTPAPDAEQRSYRRFY